MAYENQYDVGIIFSTDTDWRPALEYVLAQDRPLAEVASWRTGTFKKQLSVEGSYHLWYHRLTKDDYDAVADYRDYAKD